jgi:hypothetical protein
MSKTTKAVQRGRYMSLETAPLSDDPIINLPRAEKVRKPALLASFSRSHPIGNTKA